MILWAIVPVKPLQHSKSKLLEVLSREEIALLGRQLLTRTLETVAQVPEIEHTLVVSRDSEALAIAREHGAKTVTERGSPELAAALARASLVVQSHAVSSVLVLPADLPLLTSEDIRRLILLAGTPPEILVVPDRRGSSINAILASPPDLMEYDFGMGSLARQIEKAERAGIKIKICHLPSLELDLDTPGDLKTLQDLLVSSSLIQEKE